MWSNPYSMTSPLLLTLGGLTLALVSCGSLQDSIQNLKQPLTGETGFDPLGSPTSNSASRSASGSSGTVSLAPNAPSYKSGQWVETSLPGASFFRKIPTGSGTARADRVLDAGTPLKVIANKGAHVKVQLDSGDVGYVPHIMVIERAAGSSLPSSNPIGPVPEYGSVPPPIEPTGVPALPDALPSLPSLPSLPEAPPVPDVAVPPVPDVVPSSAPFVAPPPEIPGITDPVPAQ